MILRSVTQHVKDQKWFAVFIRAVELRASEDADIKIKSQCDHTAMRANQSFLNDFAAGVDRYDAFVMLGIIGITDQLEELRAAIDAELGVER